MFNSLRSFVGRLENADLGLVKAAFVFFSVVFIRNYLDIFSDNHGVFINHSHFFLHYPLFYLAAFFMVVLSLHIFSGVDVNKVAKAVLAFFPVIFLTPAFDLLYSRGSDVNYLYGSPEALISSFLSFYGTPAGTVGGASLGLRIELAVIILLSMLYVFLKKQNVVRSLLQGLALYSLIFLLACIPQILGMLWVGESTPDVFLQLINQETFGLNRSTADKMALILSPLTLLLVAAWAYLSDAGKFRALVNNMRFLRLAHYVGMLSLGVVLSYGDFPAFFDFGSPFTYLVFFNMLACVALTWMGAVNINDLWDHSSDELTNSTRPLPKNVFGRDEFIQVTALYVFASLFFAATVSYQFLVLVVLYHIVSALYSVPPVRLKRFLFVSKLCIGFASLLMVFAGYVATNPYGALGGVSINVCLFIFLGYSLASHVIDLKDSVSDGAAGVKSLPTVLGLRTATLVTSVLVGVVFFASPLVFGFGLLVPAILFGSYCAWAVNRAANPEHYVFWAALFYSMIVLGYLLSS